MDNLISRQAVTNAIKTIIGAAGNDIDYDAGLRTAVEIVNELPSVQPERKKGKWIIEPYDTENDIWAHRCGACLKVALLGGKKVRFNYCPNCGAGMRGEQDEID